MNQWLVAGWGMVLTLAAARSVDGQIAPLPTAETGLVGYFASGPVDTPLKVNQAEFESWFGSENSVSWLSEIQGLAFFQQGGTELTVVRVAPGEPLAGDREERTGMRALDMIADLRLLLVPDLTTLPAADLAGALATLRAYVDERQLFAILDPPPGLASANAAVAWVQGTVPADVDGFAMYFPYLELEIGGASVTAGASGTMAAVYAANDEASGIWRSPAGTNLPLAVAGLSLQLSSGETDLLNTNHINAIREFAGIGIVPWGSRTMDRLSAAGERRFIATSRLLRWLEGSLARGLAFAANRENDSTLWSELRGDVEDFLLGLWQEGALQGVTPEDAFFVRCDASTTTAADIAEARVVVLLGVALIRPTEFAFLSLELATFDPSRQMPEIFLHANVVGNDLYLAYPTSPGFSYRMQSSASLSFAGGSAWMEGDGAWRRERYTINAASWFYRVLVESGR